VTKDEASRVIEKRATERGGLISILEEIQASEGFLPEDVLRLVAEKTNRSLTDVYGVATFYRAFSLKPRGKHLVSVCLGTACHVRGGQAVAQAFSRELGVGPGETTPDQEFTLETVNCLGACALGPIVVADGRYLSKVRPNQVKQILADCRAGHLSPREKSEVEPLKLLVKCPSCNHALLEKTRLIDGQPAIELSTRVEQREGRIALSSLYGSSGARCEPGVDDGAVLPAFCPHCRASLVDSYSCDECEAPVASLAIAGGGTFRICLRWGCNTRTLDLG
jgi:NADH:ubiquinone oxidoreductase subunit E